MKKKLLLSAMLLLCVGMVNAQKIYTYVQQNGVPLTYLGTAAFDATKNPEVTFENGKAVMKIDDNTVAELPLTENGELVVEFNTSLADEDLNKVSKNVSDAEYATIYSPFQLQVPANSDVEVYIPTYDSENKILKCNESTKVFAEEIVSVETGLLLKNAGTIDFTISDGEANIWKMVAS